MEAQLLDLHRITETARGVVRGTINGEELIARIEMESVPSVGLQMAKVLFETKPSSFAPLAASGSSWLSWCNDREAVDPPEAVNLTMLTGGNYTLDRRNEFPDGSVLNMHFEVQCVGEREVEMEAKWEGNYTLPLDIARLEMPLVQDLENVEPGHIKCFYRYTIVMTNGKRYDVDTPSEYKFDPIPGRPAELPFKQRRVTTLQHSWHNAGKELRLVSQSVMVPSESVPQILINGHPLLSQNEGEHAN